MNRYAASTNSYYFDDVEKGDQFIQDGRVVTVVRTSRSPQKHWVDIKVQSWIDGRLRTLWTKRMPEGIPETWEYLGTEA